MAGVKSKLLLINRKAYCFTQNLNPIDSLPCVNIATEAKKKEKEQLRIKSIISVRSGFYGVVFFKIFFLEDLIIFKTATQPRLTGREKWESLCFSQ